MRVFLVFIMNLQASLFVSGIDEAGWEKVPMKNEAETGSASFDLMAKVGKILLSPVLCRLWQRGHQFEPSVAGRRAQVDCPRV